MALRDLIATPEQSAYFKALRALRRAGWSVASSEIPGLVYVGGHEMTIGQVFDLASKQQSSDKEYRPL